MGSDMGLIDRAFEKAIEKWPGDFSVHCRVCGHMIVSKRCYTEKQWDKEHVRVHGLMNTHVKTEHGK